MDTYQELQAIVLEWNEVVAQEKLVDQQRDLLRQHIADYAKKRKQLFLDTLTRLDLNYCTYRKHVVPGPVALMFKDFEFAQTAQGKLWSEKAIQRNQTIDKMCEHCIEEVQRRIANNADRETIFFFASATERDGCYYWFAPGGGSSIVDPKFCVFPHIEITSAMAKDYNLPPEISLPFEPRLLKIGNTYHKDTINTATT